MSNTNLIIAGLAGCLFVVSCNPLPVGPDPRYRPSRYNQDNQRPDANRYPAPDGRYNNDRYGDDRYGDNRYGDSRYGDSRYNDDGRGAAPQPRPAPQPSPQPTRDQYPTAERTNNPNQVLSPYAPYNVIDVEGFRAGQLAKDPSNGKIFRVP